MANKEQQVKHSFIYLFSAGIENLVPFITLPIFTRILTVEDYGLLALAQIYALVAIGVANCGLQVAYNRNYFQYAGDKLKSAQLLFSTLTFVFCNYLILGSLTYAFRGTLAKVIMQSPLEGNLLFFVFCANGFLNLKQYYLLNLRNAEKAKSYMSYIFAGSFIYLVLSLYFVVYLRIGVIGIAYAQLLTYLGVFALLTLRYLKQFSFSLSNKILIEAVKIGIPLTPMNFFGVIGNHFDKYMLGFLATIGGVGIYSIGQKFAMIIFIFMTALQNVFSPQIYKRMFSDHAEEGKTIGTYLVPFVYLIICFAVLLVLFSEEVIQLMTPVAFHGASDILMVLALYYGILFFGKINGDQLIFKKKTHITTILMISGMALNILMNIPFILKWGAIGAAWATFLARFIIGSIGFVIAQKFYPIVWEYKKMASMYLILFAAAVGLFMMRQVSMDYMYRLLFKGVVLGGYGLLGIKLHLISKENVRLVSNLFNRRPSALEPSGHV